MQGYTDAIADKLGIARERVAIRGEEVMQNVVFEEDIKKDSLLVTPVGICMNYYEQSNNFIFVHFNGNRIKMYDNNNLTVADVAMQAQFPKDGLFPKRGKELTFTVNGKKRIVRGFPGEAAVVEVNNKIVDLNTTIHENDMIQVTESTAGEEAKATIGDLPEASENITVIVNEQKIIIPKFAQVNGELQSSYYEIREDDKIELLNYYTVQQIAEFMDVALAPDMNLYVNHQPADRETPVYENFSVVWTKEDGEDTLADTEPEIQEPEEAKSRITVVVNQAPVTLEGKHSYVFVDVFEAIDFDLTRPQGKNIVTKLNGRPAQYMELLQDGDVIDIHWEQ